MCLRPVKSPYLRYPYIGKGLPRVKASSVGRLGGGGGWGLWWGGGGGGEGAGWEEGLGGSVSESSLYC